jgi:hypothetical protein
MYNNIFIYQIYTTKFIYKQYTGHCLSTTVKDYYLLQDRVADFKKATSSFLKVASPEAERDCDQSNAEEEGMDDTTAITLMEPSTNWGTAHPYGMKTDVFKVTWSPAEIKYIGKTAEEIKSQQGNSPKRLCAQILRKIVDDPSAKKIFHIHHVFDSTRIRSGYEAYLKSTGQNII